MSFKIHPGIGIARVGNSVEFFIGPETLEIPPVPVGGYRDGAQKIRRQAARFRVFEYDDVTGALLGERTGQPGYTFEWTVRLRRRENPGSNVDPVLINEQSIAGPGQTAIFPAIAYPTPPTASHSFGELRTDPEGRLLVLSTTGFSPAFVGTAFDGVCDGTVEVLVTGPASSDVAATSAWVFVGPPDFAPGRQPASSLYDKLYQAYVDNALFTGIIDPSPKPSFRRDILPILHARNQGRHFSPAIEAGFPLLGGIAERQALVDSTSALPYSGVTAVQSQMLERWVGDATFPDGDFTNDWPPAGPLAPSPEELDRGAIRHCLVCGTWEMSLRPPMSVFGAGTPHIEPFRLAATEPLLPPTLNWITDLPACSWVPQTELPALSLDGWYERGFMILDGDDLTYVEHTDDPYVLLLTPALAFGDVQTGPGGSTSYKSLAVSFEIRAGMSAVSVTVTSAPAGLTWTSVPDVAASTEKTVHIWVTYDTSLVVSPLDDTLQVTAAGQPYSIPVSGTTVPFKNTKLALALDCSYSMTESAGPSLTKMDVLKAAIGVLIQVGRQGDALAFAPFSTDALSPNQPLLALGPPVAGEPNRQALLDFVDDHLPISSSTSIGDGLVAASTLLAAPTPGFTYDNAAIIVVTDGKETAGEYITAVADQITSTTFALGIGTASNVDFGTLQTLTGNRGGAILLTGNPASGDNRYALEKNLLQILHGARNDEIILDPPGTIPPGRVHELEIPITEAESSFEATVVSDEAELLGLALVSPEGETIGAGTLSTLPGAALIKGPRVRSLTVLLPLKTPQGRFVHEGTWRLRLSSQLKRSDDLSHVSAVAPVGKAITYSALVSARSAIRFRANLTQEKGLFLLEAVTSVFGAPPRRAPRIVAEVRGPNQSRVEVLLKEAEPGRYLAEYRPGSLGDYHVRLRAQGRSRAGYPFLRELSLVGASLGAEDSPWQKPADNPRGSGDEPLKPTCSDPGHARQTLASLLEHAAAALRKKRRGKDCA
jgi:hypothetical protein